MIRWWHWTMSPWTLQGGKSAASSDPAATSGAVRIDGTIINLLDQTQLTDFRRRHMGFIFQSYNLLPHLSLLENTALPLLFEGISRNTREAKAAALLKAVGLEDRMRHKPGQMSFRG